MRTGQYFPNLPVLRQLRRYAGCSDVVHAKRRWMSLVITFRVAVQVLGRQLQPKDGPNMHQAQVQASATLARSVRGDLLGLRAVRGFRHDGACGVAAHAF